jgi:glycosyltransferase involved in cell wall biosynthesis
MKISWLSNAPWASTGYGNQTRVFVPRLKQAGHDVAITAFYGLDGGVLNWNGIPVYPKGYHNFGNDIAAANAKHFGADIMISLVDVWPMDAKMAQLHGVKWVPWYPVDSEPLPPPVMRSAAAAFDRIVFSKFGQRMTNQAGLTCHYVPHGVDTSIFKPSDKKAARERLGLPDDAFIVGMVAANKGTPSRKAYTQNIEAFSRLKRKHRDAVLYLHTTKSENGEMSGVNLVEYCQFLGLRIGTDVLFCDQYSNVLGFPDEHMADLYNTMDVHMLVSMGEGFGIPVLEAQACGVPVIVGDWTAMSELCFAGWKVDKADAVKFWTPLACYQYLPKAEAIADALIEAYSKAGKDHLKKDARIGALAYDADAVTERYWVPVLQEIERRLEAEHVKDAA